MTCRAAYDKDNSSVYYISYS